MVTTPWSHLLEEKTKETPTRIPFINNRTLPSLSEIINTHWSILQSIDRNISDVSVNKPIISCRRNANLKDFVGSHSIKINTNVNRKGRPMRRNTIGKCKPCFSKEGNLCYIQIKPASSFKRHFDTYHNVDCKSMTVIYFMECDLCTGKQYVGKCESSLNIRINTHRSDVRPSNGPPCDKHFQLNGRDFNKHARFKIIERVEQPPDKNADLCAL